MIIAADARSLTQNPTGVGHFLLAAVNVWARAKPEIRFVLLAHKPIHPSAEALLEELPNVTFHHRPAPAHRSNSFWWLVTTFARMARSLGATHLWGASGLLPPVGNHGLVTLLTVHDLVYRSMPWTMSLRSRLAYGLLAGWSIRDADRLWAVSSYTAGQIKHFYRSRKCEHIIVGSGLNPIRSQRLFSEEERTSVIRRYGVMDRTLLFVGTLEPRKNLRFLLSLMPKLSQQHFNLLIVGCSGWGKTDIAALMASPGFPAASVRFCNYVPDEDLQCLYHCVAAFVSTSLMEGFGLPHLEAMNAGCPVIAADNSAVSEVVAGAGTLLKNWVVDDWIKEITATRLPDVNEKKLVKIKVNNLSFNDHFFTELSLLLKLT